jgi:IS4 transposase
MEGREMLAAQIIERFKQKRPVCLLARMVLARLLSDEALNRVFQEHAKTQYQRQIVFSALTQMMADIALSFSPSVNAAYKKNKSSLGACLTAVLNKLQRVEPQVAQALVRYSYAEGHSICNHLCTGDASYITGYRTKILDGNHLSGTEHRIKELRCERAAALPGKSLVVLDPHLRLLQDFFPIEDGHAQERSALDEVIQTIEPKDLWIADRNFCTLKFLNALDARRAAFVIRHHEQVGGQLTERRMIGETATGTVYECSVTLSAYEGRELTLRRIEVELFKPTRDKETVVFLLTNVDVSDADALQIADIYLKRWKIETAFQVLTTTLRCEINTLGYPHAALFAFAVALLAYNAVIVVQSVIRAEHGKENAEQLSKYYMALEIAEASDGMMVLLEEGDFAYLKLLSTEEFCTELREVARHIDLEKYRKNVRGPKKPQTKKPPNKRAVHLSTAKILAQRKIGTNQCM